MTPRHLDELKYRARASFRLPALAAVATTLFTARPAHADWIRDFSVDALYHSNLSHSERDSDIRDDFAFVLNAHVGKYTHMASRLRFTVTLDAASEAWVNYHDFYRVSLGGTASLRYRFALGADSPFIRLEGSARYDAFGDDDRDGPRYRGSVTVGKRFFQRLELEAAYVYDNGDARNTVFAQEGHSFVARIAYDLTPSTRLTAEYSVRQGEVVSYAVPPRPDIVALANERIPVTTFGTPYTAYNLDATTHGFAFGIAQAITSRLGASFRYEYQITSRDQLEYKNHVFLTGLQLSF